MTTQRMGQLVPKSIAVKLGLKRSPPWLTDEHKHQMYLIYKDAHSRGLHVDHIVPLRGKLVSGLHVPWNLQPLEPVQNSRKRNHFEVTL